jgi:hypothetical protein
MTDLEGMSLNQIKSYLEDEKESIKNEYMFLQDGTSDFIQRTKQDHLLYNSAHKQDSTVDMSTIDPMIVNYGLMSMQPKADVKMSSNDSDSLLNDIDMLT